MRHVESLGLNIAYRSVGHGPPLVLLHGGMADSRVWAPQMESLADRWTVVAWDAPGCGASDDPPVSWRLPDYAECLTGVIEQVTDARPHVVGLSFGAGLAIELYRQQPRLPASLVLAGAYAGWAGSLPPDQVAQRRTSALRDAGRPSVEWAEEYLPGMFGTDPPDGVVDALRTVMCDTRPAGMVPMLEAFAAADLREVLPHIDVPTLLLYGERDARATRSVREGLYQRIPGADLWVLPRLGHVMNLEDPAMFNDALNRFLTKVGAAAEAR